MNQAQEEKIQEKIQEKVQEKVQEKYNKKTIPKGLREQVWIQNCGKHFKHKCKIVWCQNQINVFDFHCGHIIAEKEGGKTSIDNLLPICSRCNLSMGINSISNWNLYGKNINISKTKLWYNKMKTIFMIICK
jgi:5-methylcytosine-specific restriction endonuclease McrA